MNETFDFSEALKRVKAGGKIQREGWNGKGQYVFLVEPPLPINAPDGAIPIWLPFLAISTVTGQCVPWLISMTDALAYDWTEL